VTYSLERFFDSGVPSRVRCCIDKPACEGGATSTDTALFHIVVYLSPGSYHRIHAPCDMHIDERRHVPGYLLSVDPVVLADNAGLFGSNERVILNGTWKYGFFSCNAVGACMVGSIHLPAGGVEECKRQGNVAHDPLFLSTGGWSMVKGRDVGYFTFGSTVVLIFEAPIDFRFSVHAGDRVRVGQAMSTSAFIE